MAEKIKTSIKSFAAQTVNTSANRTFGARIMKPGTYKVPADAEVNCTPRMIAGRAEPYYQIEVTCEDGKSFDIQSLRKQTVNEDGTSLKYINSFVEGFDGVEAMLNGIAGKTITVSDTLVDCYTTFRNGVSLDAPVKNGKAYVASIA